MISNRWIEQRKGSWGRLDTLTRQVESSGIRVLSGTELRELGLLYRQAAADLSAVRSDRASGTLEEYLNGLLSRAHNRIYSGRKAGLGSVYRFFSREYPPVFRQLFPYVAASFLIFLAGAVLGTLLTLSRPDFMRLMLGPAMLETIERHEMWTHSIVSMKPQASSAILTNNISVSFAAFAGGILAGLGTIFLMFQNGLQMGVISTACSRAHMALDLFSFVAAHGALELPSIFIAGGAGLRLTTALLFPGMLSRRDSLAQGGREAIRLLAGVIPLLVVAGMLEAFLSPSGAPAGVKFAVGAALLSGLAFWLAEGGSEKSAG
ncbi:putative membrane protein SpoIIM required for sporulation [Silvibacterium bohemicum]|uniref:Putative membrane protein SpoIIM required for sporulation n=1 Tax=Silvibacterium bohemicum TaxID=1577686 RepID=A0A841K106_9BACT|nr:stage II sporulation protein M [Silvibacterium bohemicum]MBB6144881.1 putative membrane protein SpoIIM required for sporulation [Silvibacterium bohemicum]